MAEPNMFRSSVECEVMWAPWEGPGLEHLRLVTSDGDAVVANGWVIGLEAGRPFLELLAAGEGHWKRRGGEPMPDLDGCIDVDISATPFTNTLPIRRLGFEPGQSEELTVAYIRVPELLIGPERQRYGCLEARVDDGLYRFEALPSGFTAELPVDADGLVLDYPGLFRRAWSG